VASRGKPYRTILVDGFEVLAGRGSVENDHLTFAVAEAEDVWLHVAGGSPGSHVVIRNPGGGAVPRVVIEKAAAIAAWYSKERDAANVVVHFCRAAHVTKPRGAPAGLVQMTRHESVRVRPGLPSSGADVL
jgi:predicted ribosome quality control (RQC) complex YloA/Tae2 family protein